MLVVDQLRGQLIESKDALFADRVMRTRDNEGPWAVIDLLIKQWVESNPQKYDSFVMSVDNKRDSRATRYGSNVSKTIREIVDFPQPIHDRIRTIYKADELPMDREFFREIWRRYPTMRVAERL